MHKGRLEAFSDGVLAIIITIMVLDFKVPHGADWNSVISILSEILTYALSFVYVGIYWSNHHNMVQTAKRVSGAALWANLHLLFWLSLIPFATRWLDESGLRTFPVAVYGFLLFMAAVAYTILSLTLVAVNGKDSAFARALGKDTKGKISLLLYGMSIACAWFAPQGAPLFWVAVAIIWLVPDRRFERVANE